MKAWESLDEETILFRLNNTVRQLLPHETGPLDKYIVMASTDIMSVLAQENNGILPKFIRGAALHFSPFVATNMIAIYVKEEREEGPEKE